LRSFLPVFTILCFIFFIETKYNHNCFQKKNQEKRHKEQGLLSAGKYGTILINYPVHGREKEPIFKNGKTLLNGILHVYTRTMGFSQYIGIVCCGFSEKYPI